LNPGINTNTGQAHQRSIDAVLSAPARGQIAVASHTLYTPGNTQTPGSNSTSGLSDDTMYQVFRTVGTGSYSYISGDANSYFTDSVTYLYIGGQRTQTAGGTYSPPPPLPPGGGGTNAGYCVAPEHLVQMADGSLKPAGEVRPGDRVRTQHEHVGGWRDFEVTEAETLASRDRMALHLHDGRRLIAAPNHRLYASGRGWTELQHLAGGEWLTGSQPGQVSAIGQADDGPVVRLLVADAHTYLADGLLSHNSKVYY
jgi:hypothetical protein